MRRSLLTLALLSSLAQAAQGQEPQPHAPWLNAFGRFWGIGYSAGYHAQTSSRLGFHHYSPDHNVVPQPPRGMYANPNLYSGPAAHASGYPSYMNTGYPNAGYSNSMVSPLAVPTPAPNLMAQPHNMVPPPPAKPVDPPPNWLKQYIKPDAERVLPQSEELLNENSPSDRKGVMLDPSPADSTTSISITPAEPPVQIGGRPVISVLQQ